MHRISNAVRLLLLLIALGAFPAGAAPLQAQWEFRLLPGDAPTVPDYYGLMLCRWTRNFQGEASPPARMRPVLNAWLQRVLDTPAQQQLDAATRKRNLRKAFALAPGSAISGRHIALVDDVLTTGATAESLARLLSKAGAARVDVYCLARTPKPGD